MTQENKELLLKDLSARLPYGVKIELMPITRGKCTTLTPIILYDYYISDDVNYLPYLFPLSSMTDKQRKEYEDALTYHDYVKGGWIIAKSFDNEYIIPYWFIDFCNKNHIDYRGLIEKGLAIDATELNIY